MIFAHALQGVFVLVLLGAIGYAIAALKWVGSESRTMLPRIITNISLPPYLMYTIMQYFQRDNMLEMFKGILPSFISVCIAFSIAITMAKIFHVDRKHFGLFCAAISNSNTIFIGIPVNISLFGESAMPYVLLYYVSSTIFFWTIGQYVIISDVQDKSVMNKRHIQISKIFSPPLLGFITGLFFTAVGLDLPDFVKLAAQNLGNLTTPLAMMFIGISIHDMGFKHINLSKDMMLLIIGRMIIAPIIMFCISRLFKLQDLISNVFIVQSSLPVMMQAAILSAYYKADSNFGSQAVAYTTILSIFFIPVIMVLIH